jgi:hypothetical protein
MRTFFFRYNMAFLVAVVWGYFVDLKHDDVSGFVLRLLIAPLFAMALFFLFDLAFKKKKPL